jgi:ubiquinone/menaquinone biosynthesis C-methylase UbiE
MAKKWLTTRGFEISLLLLSLVIPPLSGCSSFTAYVYNKSASAPKNKPDEVIRHLEIQPGMQIADLGAGGGYYTVRFAQLVGEQGKVYAVDVNENFLNIIGEEGANRGLKNIRTILANPDDSLLPEKSVDLVFVRNVYHHLPSPEKYFQALKKKLRPGGRVAIVEYRKLGFFSLIRIFGHYTAEEEVLETMGRAGYRLANKYEFLKKQSFTIYSSPEAGR